MKDFIERAKRFLMTRRLAYISVFDNPVGRDIVLKDLARFCRAHETTFHKDPRAEGIMQGRREVWLRIQHHLRLSDDELWAMYQGSAKRSPD